MRLSIPLLPCPLLLLFVSVMECCNWPFNPALPVVVALTEDTTDGTAVSEVVMVAVEQPPVPG